MKKERAIRKQKGNHSFNVKFATIVGVNKAIIANNYVFRWETNYANNKAEHLERNRVFNSSTALGQLFPYMNERAIRRGMQEMVDDGYFFVGNFNKNKYDQTKWYSPTNKLLNILELDGLGETDEYYKILDKPLKIKNGQIDQSNGGFDQSNGSGDRPIHNIEEDIEKYIESSNTNFPDGKIGNPDISDFDLVDNKLFSGLPSLKNNKKWPAAPKSEESNKVYGLNYYNILNAQSLIGALEEVGINNIHTEYILNNRRLLQALGEIKGDVEIIREAVGGVSDVDDLSEFLVNEMFRINNNHK